MIGHKSPRDMTPAEKAEARAELEAYLEARPEAIEEEPAQVFTPGVICFRDSQYKAVSPDVATVWPLLERGMEHLLRFLPVKHRMECVKERAEKGAFLTLLFIDDGFTRGDKPWPDVGLLSCERADDGASVVGIVVHTLDDQLDLTHAACIAESVAVMAGMEQVRIWTPVPVPMVKGYRALACRYGHMQVADAQPIQ